jgi:hypothetical protein
VHSSFTVALNAANFLLSLQLHLIGLLYSLLACMHLIHFSGYNPSLELVTLRLLHIFFIDLLEEPLFIVDIELIGEPVAEHVILLKVLN